jgi:predicted O-linked N-acetylglucosamine transferase (SPINDLY family)
MTAQPPLNGSGPNGSDPNGSDPAAVHVMVGRAMALHQSGQLSEAERVYKSVLKAQPNHFEALHFQGLLEAQRGNFAEADRLMRRSLKVNGKVADAHANHARVLNALKCSEEALAACDRALAINPRSLEALVSRGNALSALDRHEEALGSFDRAVALRPDYFAALTNRGGALMRLKRYEEARLSYQRALALKPGDANTLNLCGVALELSGQLELALASYQAACAADPAFVDAAYGRAVLLIKMDRLYEAVVACEHARSIGPDHPDAFGRLDIALMLCDWASVERLSGEFKAQALAGKSFNSFAGLFIYDDPLLHQACAENRVRSISTQPFVPCALVRHARIRVAYCTPDFRSHPTSYLIAELIERHDRDRFEIFGISFGPDDKSDMRRRMAGAFDRFHDVRALDSRDIANRIRELEVDIAVDLAGHAGESRPEIFSYRPAPIQVSYLGFPGTSGAAFFDYCLADPIVLPFDQQPFFSERIVHLPGSYQAHSFRPISERVPTRQEVGLPDNGFVFCCFNNAPKITAPVFDIWMRLLAKIDNSVLWLFIRDRLAQENLRRRARNRAINPDRLIFAPKIEMRRSADHLARHRLADLFLDTFPYNAHTTAQDALWAGLPLVTYRGQAFAARVAASLLHAVGLPELIAESLEDYEALAFRLATDPALLGAVRDKLARNRLTHPLFDTGLFCRHVEAAYTRMWEIWQGGEHPRSFAIDAIKPI